MEPVDPSGEHAGITLRVLAYNIRHAQGVGGIISTPRVARVVNESRCQLAALTEVWRIGARFDQPGLLAEQTGYAAEFQPLHRLWRREAGNLLLADAEVLEVYEIALGGRREPRGCLVANVEVSGLRMSFAVTHLSLHRETRRQQLELLQEQLPSDRPLVLAGDLNCEVGELRGLSGRLVFPLGVPATYPSVRPFRALDHIGFSRHWSLESLEAVPSLASDHRPLVAQLRFAG